MQQEKKYIPFEQIKITDRQWPDKTIIQQHLFIFQKQAMVDMNG